MNKVPQDLSGWKEEEMIKYAEELGRRFARQKKITTSQLRNVFSDINRIRMEWKFGELEEDRLPKELLLLKPKLAYAAGRHANVKELKNELEKAIDAVVKSSNIKAAADNFFRFVESVVAYHKYYGGK